MHNPTIRQILALVVVAIKILEVLNHPELVEKRRQQEETAKKS